MERTPGDNNIHTIVNYYRRLILTERIAIGDPLPSREEMQERHGISQSDADMIYARLAAMKLATRCPPSDL